GAALVVLPGGLIAAPRGGDDGGARGVDRDLAAAAQRQQLGGAVEVDRPQLGVPRDRGAVAAGGEDPAVGQPAGDLGGGAAPGGEAARGGVALGGDHPPLGAAGGAGGEGDVGAVGGEARIADGSALVGQPPGAAPGQRGQPDVVRGGEGDEV